MIEDVSIESSSLTDVIAWRVSVEEDRTTKHKKRMSANKAKQSLVFSRVPHLNSCFSLKAPI